VKERIQEGDCIRVFDINGKLITRGIVLYIPIVTGDSWVIRPQVVPSDSDKIIGIQNYGYMELLYRGDQK